MQVYRRTRSNIALLESTAHNIKQVNRICVHSTKASKGAPSVCAKVWKMEYAYKQENLRQGTKDGDTKIGVHAGGSAKECRLAPTQVILVTVK